MDAGPDNRFTPGSPFGPPGAPGDAEEPDLEGVLRPPPWCSEAAPVRALVDETLGRVTQLAVATIPPCHMAELVIMCDHGPVSRGATDGVSVAIASLRRRVGRGPSIEAWVRGETVHADLAAIRTRWPELADRAVEFDVGDVLAVPVIVGDVPAGTLTAYAPFGTHFTQDDEHRGATVALRAAVALAGLGLRAANTEVLQLQEALRSRATIEQAKGILIAQHGCSPDEAFTRLTRRSQRENRKLRDVAADLVAGAAPSGTGRRLPGSPTRGDLGELGDRGDRQGGDGVGGADGPSRVTE